MSTSVTIRASVADRAATEQLAGTTLAGRYDVLELLGVGGMGAVYRTLDRELDEVVALKVIRSDQANRRVMVEQFRQEVKLARRVTHVNIARTFELGVVGDLVFCTMELVEGESLRARLAREGALRADEAAEIACALCEGLAVAHAAGVIHRDIKPENVLLEPRGRVVLADFGVAAFTTADSDGSLVGTPEYMAPEQALGEPPTPATDVYALGVVVFEMLTGLRPFTGTTLELLAKKLDVDHLDLGAAAAVMIEPPSPELVEIIARATARDPASRIGSARELGRRLEPWLRVQAVTTSPGVQEPPARVEDGAHTLETVVVLAPRVSEESSRKHIAEGVHQELLRRLAQRPRLRVWPRVDPVDEPQATVVELYASTVLAVTIRRDEHESTLQLPLDISNIGLAADAIAIAIANVIERAANPRDESTDESFEMLLRARVLAHTGFTGLGPAYELLCAAHDRFPADPRISCELASLVLRFSYTSKELPYNFSAARGLVESALAAAPELAEAHVAAGHLELHTGDAVLAAREFRTAIACSPYLAEPHEGLGRMLLEAGFLDDALARLDDALAIAPDLSAVRWEIARAHALEQNWFAHDQLVATLRQESDRPIARFRFAVWRDDRAEMISSRQAWRNFVGRFEPKMFDMVFESLLDDQWQSHRSSLIAMTKTMSSPSKRRTAFFSQLVAEVAGRMGDLDASLEMIAFAVDRDLFDHHWLARCPTLEAARATPEGARLQAIVKRRANAILDALYCDRASVEDTVRIS